MRQRLACLTVMAAVLQCACNGGSPAAPAPPPPVPSPPSVGSTSGRLVNALNGQEPVAGASVFAGPVTQTTSDPSGHFALAAPPVAPASIRITRDGWVDRSVLFRIPGEPVTVSLIPGTFNLTYFNEMCRYFGRISRWSAAPVLVVETAVIEYGTRVALSEEVPPHAVSQTTEELRRTLPVLTAGRFSDYASVEFRRTPVGERSFVPDGAVMLSWQRGLLEKFGHVAYGGRNVTASDGGLRSGEVALDYDWRVFGLPQGSRRDIVPVEQHELGHALGYSHTKTAPSFMYEVFLMTVSPLDRQAFEIVMQRPNGNTSPDQDPSGSSLNATTPGGMVIERCESLRMPSR